MSNSGLNLVVDFDKSVEILNDSLQNLTSEEETKFSAKVDILLNARLATVPYLTAQLDPKGSSDVPDKTSQINALLHVITGIETSLYRKKDMEAKEEVDISHPKFQKALEWVIEATTIALQEVGVEDSHIANYIHKLSQRMVGFEEEANKRLKGVAFNRLETVENPIPLIEVFNEIRRGGSTDLIVQE